jgi:flagellar hook-length control protein FliK
MLTDPGATTPAGPAAAPAVASPTDPHPPATQAASAVVPQPAEPISAGAAIASADRRTAARAATEATAQPVAGTNQPLPQPASVPIPQAAAPVAVAAPPAAPAHAATTGSPLAQLAPTLVTLARTADGTQQMTVRLHPAELGMVQVRIERATSGLTQVDITADKPETLLALQRDQPALHRTLDQAGVPSAGRTISFHAVPPAPASSGGASTTFGQGGGQSQSSAGRAGYGNTDADGSTGGGRGGYFTREAKTWPNGRPASAAPDAAADPRPYRAGLDITA